ncbi:DNA polymerase IV [Glaciimonas soli]|uniref:DNA polymerase IV n=1 Tax=Glaciimonas soli TaxID=2590999 RepID=A0A843YQY0_9BURK|nr:DNA polymerase IV [Glaciimonas soli]MQQ99135.1 DNA polymerase IV [Glaciimonas soli]
MTSNSRRIAHLDMDAFYASVELLRYPELRGLPVVIGGGSANQPVTESDGTRRFFKIKDYAGRGVVTTSTYAARALGVFSAMGIMKAAHLAPEAILLPTDFDAYRHYSRLFKQAVAKIAPLIEDRGIDEIYIDLSDEPGETQELAMKIKAAVFDATQLSCSIGIAPNKLLAKICSDLEKPNGLTILQYADIPSRIWPLPARKVNGIGPKADAKLASIGIFTVGDLASADPDLLQTNFTASYASWLRDIAQGIDERPVATVSETKSISRETTFERDMHARHDRAALTVIFDNLCQRVAGDLVRKGYVGRTVGIKLRYTDFKIMTRVITLPTPTADALTIRRAAGECLQRIPLEQRFRLLGVRVDNLSKPQEASASDYLSQKELFSD